MNLCTIRSQPLPMTTISRRKPERMPCSAKIARCSRRTRTRRTHPKGQKRTSDSINVSNEFNQTMPRSPLPQASLNHHLDKRMGNLTHERSLSTVPSTLPTLTDSEKTTATYQYPGRALLCRRVPVMPCSRNTIEN